MFETSTNFRHNWILILAIILGTAFGLMSFFLEIKPPVSSADFFEGVKIPVFIVIGTVIMPVLEELSFRGFFSNSNKMRAIALIGFLSISSSALYSNYSIVFASLVLVLMVVLTILYFKFRNNIIFVLFVISNALVFGLIHYSAKDFAVQGNPFVMVQIGAGLFLTWVTLNSRLRTAMLVHGVWNFIALASMLLSLQFVSKEIEVIEQGKVKVSYQQVPVFASNAISLTNESNKMVVKNATIRMLMDLALIDRDLKDKYSSVDPLARYNFTIEFKDDKRNFEEVLKILQEKEMVVRN
ncbi:hypothetical protein FLJC2902T_12180 [Flavobacterium limnosediminis JC2902]|uniref:CAAX prenyl protease 2/Lysostaphin resistance protein A-like domain-containing protein n=1 Tax=Flavobacterium limnosediminis JC2902 TaxID=1341181 RepID=V6SRC7_9FLAO|nr:CPBP family intramembrane glutamic endopeptidase [Flavobacterium limnosediminis]ESU29176.1 hypothetical protein FLJC2902T_12180 [Flavobacterium limnosediminis JC2902]